MTSARLKELVIAEVTRRGLVSIMNNTKWIELRDAVRNELPFAPPFQLKDVLNKLPQPEQFESDVNYLGDWSDESLSPFFGIEWLRIRPRYLSFRHQGRLIAPEVQVQSVESELRAILHRYNIPYRQDGDSIWIFGYQSATDGLIAYPGRS